MTNQKFDAQTVAKVAVLFAISYVILYISSSFFYKWDSPMYFLPPVAGFFFAYFLVDWIDTFLETRAAHEWYFPALLVVLAFVAEFIALFWYYNWGRFLGQGGIDFDFLAKFKQSAFLAFFLSVVLGWLSHIIIDSTAESKQEHESWHKRKK